MRPGDILLYYHSSCKVPGIAGIATVRPRPHASYARVGAILTMSSAAAVYAAPAPQVSSDPHPDQSAFDSKGPYYDPKSDRSAPRYAPAGNDHAVGQPELTA